MVNSAGGFLFYSHLLWWIRLSLLRCFTTLVFMIKTKWHKKVSAETNPHPSTVLADALDLNPLQTWIWEDWSHFHLSRLCLLWPDSTQHWCKRSTNTTRLLHLQTFSSSIEMSVDKLTRKCVLVDVCIHAAINKPDHTNTYSNRHMFPQFHFTV